MRPERTVQASLFDLFAGARDRRALKAISAWLHDHRERARPVAADLRRHGIKATGRQGLSAEAVLRCALLKQHRQLSCASRDNLRRARAGDVRAMAFHKKGGLGIEDMVRSREISHRRGLRWSA